MANAAEHSGVNGHAGVIGGGGSGSRLGAARLLLWALAGLLAVRQASAVLRVPPGEWLTGFYLPGLPGSLYDAGQFTGTPFAGLVLKPLVGFADQSLEVAWTCVTLLFVAAIGLVAARGLPDPVPRRTVLLAAPVLVALMMVSLPVREAASPGQTAVLPVLLVLLAFFRVPGERPAGFLMGLAAALQPGLLLFAPLLWLTGRRPTASTAVTTFASCTLLSWAALPHDSWTYWVHHLAGTGLGGSPDGLANQSLHGALLRLGLSGPAEIVLYVALAAGIAWLGMRRAARYARDGQLLLAVAITGCVAVAVSPTGWRHQLLWVLLAVAGKVGKRAADRPVWPVAVVLAMTLPSTMLLPNMAVLAPVRDNVLLLAALAAACAVPFLPRSSPYWREPVPTDYGRPAAARWSRIPLMPFWRRVLSRPNLLLELLLIRVGYSLYSYIRAAAPTSRSLAEGNGSQILSVEQALGIDIEHAVNHAVVSVRWLEAFFNFYYTSFHFVVPLTILAVLYWRRPADYRWARASLGLATVLALVGFWLFPLAPPRLMPGLGFIDTVHGVQDLAHPQYGAMTAISNQYAAMPSLHFGWSLWCGIVIVTLAPKGWQKLLGVLHPLITVCAIVATANHWVLDAVGGAAVVSAGFGLVYALSGPRGAVRAPGRAAPGAVPGPRLPERLTEGHAMKDPAGRA
ncbi:bifunctional glycosyltransferase 87/phosphatase PAP2 family protein [Streptomyces sp. G-G2]|uniref:bifunctional glycosyltransferase 87/phosphatase PAP2 family protein n=1 Tax=Streptomyces sp. G-G2 TaxID=3046201 RepID=UPI0024B90D67|nr:bifunctional glycosyltransferase 87/phosphatase PAP2 family protein [Streptomyces sp. G-G2]MDJ0385883.1 bifunctional glycosyltransferase 87/phosphatase PAP2 family protein [Streptomyces sp. G-G2]